MFYYSKHFSACEFAMRTTFMHGFNTLLKCLHHLSKVSFTLLLLYKTDMFSSVFGFEFS